MWGALGSGYWVGLLLGSAGVATHTGALPGAEQRAQHNRTGDHGRAFRNLMDFECGMNKRFRGKR